MNHNPTTSTRERIMAGAEAEFFSKGYDGARTTTIPAAAGVTHAMLHYYFRTKQNLFETVIGGKMALLHDLMLSSIGDPSIPLFDKISRCIDNHIDFIAANPQLPGFMVNVVFKDPHLRAFALQSITVLAREVITSLQQQIDDMASRGECRRVDARMLILDILSLDVMPFLISEAANVAMDGMLFETPAELVALRKKENIDTIFRKLRP